MTCCLCYSDQADTSVYTFLTLEINKKKILTYGNGDGDGDGVMVVLMVAYRYQILQVSWDDTPTDLKYKILEILKIVRSYDTYLPPPFLLISHMIELLSRYLGVKFNIFNGITWSYFVLILRLTFIPRFLFILAMSNGYSFWLNILLPGNKTIRI